MNIQQMFEFLLSYNRPDGMKMLTQFNKADKAGFTHFYALSRKTGIRYTKLDKDVNPFLGSNAKKIAEKGVTCAKCYSPDSASVVMFSATDDCPLTWEVMYTGYLMSSRVGGHTTQYVCVDETPAAGYQMDAEQNSRDTLALTVVHSSGSLPSETYVNSALIRCAVCAMKSNQISF
ncbi:hypothetical protein AVEN_35733-1 [Araneus ventricosus]|uniref:Uncharacterized protein n=1 Tax=Araneus ventricosus TaxID=182803 RepID=A0A4Y2W510_ARAVE|nr:hypothetical protein AVEN_35733-1 [Araneus ventricosus]